MNSPVHSVDREHRREFEHALLALLLRYGATASAELEGKAARCVAQIVDALEATSTDSKSLSPLDVVRIRAGKFAATLTPPGLFRDPKQLAALRAEIHALALGLVGEPGAAGSRFAPGKRK